MIPGQATPPQRLDPGETEGFASRFADAYGRLWLVAAALTQDRNDAEDLIQEAAIVGMKKFSLFDPDSNFAAWMSQIVRYQASNWRSKRTRRATHPVDPNAIDQDHSSDGGVDPPSVSQSASGSLGALADQFDDEVVDRLESLAAIPRACLLLRVIHNLTYDEIAETLAIPPGTAMSHVHRSRSKLRKQLAGDDQAEPSKR